jgi:hypothetical protein
MHACRTLALLAQVSVLAAGEVVASDAPGDWSFAAPVREITLETESGGKPHVVTLWCVVVEKDLYVATDDARERKRWVRNLRRNPAARVGIAGKTYAVRAESVREAARWRAVMAAYAKKYADEIGRYDFPQPDDHASGAIFLLRLRP